MGNATLRTNVYVDGFNLYYGALRNTPFKWLNVEAMCTLLLPPSQHSINRVRYFTARVSATPAKPQAPVNQHIYLRALRTVSSVSIHFRHFLRQRRWMPLVNPSPGGSPLAEVWRMEEKGSDVSLASHLLNDAHRGDMECAVVVSNDSDLLEPIRLVKSELGLPVGVINPQAKPAKQLIENCSFFKQIRAGVLGASQFPVQWQDAKGTFHKPIAWT